MLGLCLFLYLFKGYSLIVLIEVGYWLFEVSVIDFECKILYVCIGGDLCVVVMVDLVGDDEFFDLGCFVLL